MKEIIEVAGTLAVLFGLFVRPSTQPANNLAAAWKARRGLTVARVISPGTSSSTRGWSTGGSSTLGDGEIVKSKESRFAGLCFLLSRLFVRPVTRIYLGDHNASDQYSIKKPSDTTTQQINGSLESPSSTRDWVPNRTGTLFSIMRRWADVRLLRNFKWERVTS
jgi:hypothetical protein